MENNFINISDSEKERYAYRIMPLKRLYELFCNQENVLVKPSLWDDPFENFILKSRVRFKNGSIHRLAHKDGFYGQCWTLNKASDAMWRIYSPEKNSVRVRTTINKLFYGLYDAQIGSGLRNETCFIGKVDYLNSHNIKKFSATVFREQAGTRMYSLASSLCVKRLAFKHESEVRLLYFEHDMSKYNEELFRYQFDAHHIIDQLMLDPRLSLDEAELVKSEIKQKTGFNGAIKRSLLYAMPEEVVIEVK
ncbi:DUF2971 domain-containing protein [Vibrio metschnikovii]|uniref:DUF2971 domain-containing protein n=1 Tax=Vibrio metschnikovii TaxID=28172 RepID=UPI001C2FFC59|nr:DUF2971 domain-containing protein [Vibrio metschnikovii]EKO3566922.1 DUF2971 domain-containing protein [Vibrio metschnikovii]EKO3771238.1 DUF2971 domain-containing protein [Vibrio metschnikovii]EKO3774597.1 DUF2971 domain-containing protein [Vibrio metschnikovii]